MTRPLRRVIQRSDRDGPERSSPRSIAGSATSRREFKGSGLFCSTGSGVGGRPEVEQNRPDPFNSLLAFVPTQVPQVWFQHATFDHRAHRALDCRQCHPEAYPDAPQPSRESKDVLIPQRDVCIECHSPPSGSGTAATGGARFDCVECHRYHNGSSPLAGSGAKAGNPARTLSEEEFQIGRPHPARPDGE